MRDREAAPRTIGRLVEALAARTDWFSLHTPVPCSRALREIAHGLHLIEEQEPLMLLEDPRHLVTAANRSSVEISRLRPDEVERHVDVWARGFGVPAEALDPWLRWLVVLAAIAVAMSTRLLRRLR